MAAVAVVAVSGCGTRIHHTAAAQPAPTSAVTAAPTPHPAPTTRVSRVVRSRRVPRLVRFGDCRALLAALKRQAVREVGPYGLPGGGGVATSGTKGETAAGTAGASAGTGATGFSTTNDQERGVDEPDLTKTDGHLLVLVRHRPVGVEVIGVGAGTPRRLAFLRLRGVAPDVQLLLTGSLVVAIGTGRSHDPTGRPTTRAVVVSLAAPRHPAVVRSFDVPGQEVAARLLSGRVVLVVRRGPALRFPAPAPGRPAARLTAANRRVVASSRLRDWLPPITTAPSHRSFAPGCAATWHAGSEAGLGTVTVASFDPARESSVRQTTVLGSTSLVYASAHGLYVATPGRRAVPVGTAARPRRIVAAVLRPMTTRIHAFDLADPAAPRYLGSGAVTGEVTDRYAMSEWHGDLRVATTVGVSVPAPDEGPARSDNRVTVLRPVGGALVTVGQVRGLGRGERIYGVRFLGGLGYVVTFRQVDPLHVLDLSDPRHPREVAHLKVTGYSAYLHPLGGGLLLGLGQRVDGRARPPAEQMSVFDVSQPARPALVSRASLGDVYTPAEVDHHAFLWWAPDRLVVVPVLAQGRHPGVGVVVYHVDRSGRLGRVGTVRLPPPDDHHQYQAAERSVVVGGVLYVVSDRGVLASDLHSLKRVAWVQFR